MPELLIERRQNFFQREFRVSNSNGFAGEARAARPVFPRFEPPHVRSRFCVELFAVEQELCFELRCRLVHAPVRLNRHPINGGEQLAGATRKMFGLPWLPSTPDADDLVPENSVNIGDLVWKSA